MDLVDRLKKAKLSIGDEVEAVMPKGGVLRGPLAYRGLAGWCVLSPHGIPLSIEKAKTVRKPKGARK